VRCSCCRTIWACITASSSRNRRRRPLLRAKTRQVLVRQAATHRRRSMCAATGSMPTEIPAIVAIMP
jgi:hypothetical protein